MKNVYKFVSPKIKKQNGLANMILYLFSIGTLQLWYQLDDQKYTDPRSINILLFCMNLTLTKISMEVSKQPIPAVGWNRYICRKYNSASLGFKPLEVYELIFKWKIHPNLLYFLKTTFCLQYTCFILYSPYLYYSCFGLCSIHVWHCTSLFFIVVISLNISIFCMVFPQFCSSHILIIPVDSFQK